MTISKMIRLTDLAMEFTLLQEGGNPKLIDFMQWLMENKLKEL